MRGDRISVNVRECLNREVQAQTLWILATARPHSSGLRALRTKTRMMMSTLDSSRSEGRDGEVRSHTAAVIVPITVGFGSKTEGEEREGEGQDFGLVVER